MTRLVLQSTVIVTSVNLPIPTARTQLEAEFGFWSGRAGVGRGACNFGTQRLRTATAHRSHPLYRAQWQPVTTYGNPGRETYKQEVPGSSPGPPIRERSCYPQAFARLARADSTPTGGGAAGRRRTATERERPGSRPVFRCGFEATQLLAEPKKMPPPTVAARRTDRQPLFRGWGLRVLCEPSAWLRMGVPRCVRNGVAQVAHRAPAPGHGRARPSNAPRSVPT